MITYDKRFTIEIYRLIDSLSITLKDAQTMLVTAGVEDFFNFEDKIIYDYFGAMKRKLIEAVHINNILQSKFVGNLIADTKDLSEK